VGAVVENNDSTHVPRSLSSGTGSPEKLIETSLQKRDAVVIGRGSECDVVIHDLKASRQHCKLSRQEQGFLLEDLDSRNGTIVNGQKISEPVLLKTNSTFQIGDTMFYLS
jgi:pSer/pThr/pTyr-binding forkhead associated (FHA) protein